MKRNVFYLTLLSLLFAFSGMVSAQEKKKSEAPAPEKRIEMKAQKISKKLMLDEAASAKFVPLYKEYVAALSKCRCDAPKCKGAKMTDEQIVESLEKRYEMQGKIADVKKEYVTKFAKVLTPLQVKKLFSEDKGKMKFGKRPMQKGAKMKYEKGKYSPKKPCPVKNANSGK